MTSTTAIEPSATGEPLAFTLSRDDWGRLVMTFNDERRFIGVETVRAFPIHDPMHWLVFLDADGREILCLESFDQLSPANRAWVDEELALREFMPVIERIVAIRGETTPSEWEVITDRGTTRFTLDNDDDVRMISPSRVIITDLRKLRYHVRDIAKLDLVSRRLLERYL